MCALQEVKRFLLRAGTGLTSQPTMSSESDEDYYDYSDDEEVEDDLDVEYGFDDANIDDDELTRPKQVSWRFPLAVAAVRDCIYTIFFPVSSRTGMDTARRVHCRRSCCYV